MKTVIYKQTEALHGWSTAHDFIFRNPNTREEIMTLDYILEIGIKRQFLLDGKLIGVFGSVFDINTQTLHVLLY